MHSPLHVLRYRSGMIVASLAVVMGPVRTWSHEAEAAVGGALPSITEEFRTVDYHGKYVILSFWATWCGPCRAEVPELKALSTQLQPHHTIAFIGVSLDSDRKQLTKFLQQQRLSWPQVQDGKAFDSPLARAHHVRGIPHLALLDPEGKTVVEDGTLQQIRKELDQRLSIHLADASGSVAGPPGQSVSAASSTSATPAAPPSSRKPAAQAISAPATRYGKIRGSFFYGEHLLAELTEVTPRMWIRNEDQVSVPTLNWVLHGSTYEVRNVPFGTYGMRVLVDANAHNPPGFPGDLIAWLPQIDVFQTNDATKQDVHLCALIHLTQPVDNGTILPWSHTDSNPRYRSPMRFVWDAVPEATQYRCTISLYGEQIAPREELIGEDVRQPQWQVQLPPNTNGTFYLFRLVALHGRAPIGQLELHGRDVNAKEYWFTIEE